MISRYSVWLNDVSLSDIDPRIYVSDIAYQAASPARNTSRLAARDGQYSGEYEYIGENKITVSFAARAYETNARQQIVQEVAAWAADGGWLKTSDRMGQRIYVKCSKLPAVASVMRWTDAITVEFTAYDYPYWMDEVATTLYLEKTGSSSVSGTLTLGGVKSSLLEARASISAAATRLTFTCNDTTIALTGLSLSQGDVVKIVYEEKHHIMQIYKGVYYTRAGSLLDKRTAGSSDDLVTKVGSNAISFDSDGKGSCIFYGRGVYV